MERRKLFLLILSSDSDLGNLSISPLSSASDISFCLLFFLLFLLSLALFELNFDASEELSKSSPNPPTPLKSLDATDAAATAAVAWQVTKHGILSRPKPNNFTDFYQLLLLSLRRSCLLYTFQWEDTHKQNEPKVNYWAPHRLVVRATWNIKFSGAVSSLFLKDFLNKTLV